MLTELEAALVQHERKYVKQLLELKEERDELKDSAEDKYLQEKMEKVRAQQELYLQYQAEEELLKKIDQLEEQYKSLRMKYNNLKSSKLGKLTTKYWKWRRKRSN